eukprot:TRINITY_DN4866_c0_g1::TRINITY_DN4866_c0_g1_i1::g.940::m.940 TRINITY_DN4866_c0_g1::TRINITY_DN4866_c0_g1_i1::g.940  ORF type:complete len:547 (-),score=86.94,sp/Q86I06/NEK3_DICDI/50.37/9e-78,Pkinase/PF00069.20/1e-64,Pkinase_Tyr/PF07714.12/2.7e-40,Kinase-like/PF14531.1/83,Kinase-like/PF14531.1/0.022,SLY/PF12485.3/0.079 TRINITY_DN4866_c0_g1_i1:28-1668(-)
MPLEEYVKTHCLGRGSFGVCYLVRRKKDNRLFVIKEINVFELDPEQRNEAENEVMVLENVQHPNIITYYDSFIQSHALYIVMDYADRGTLQDLLKGQLQNVLTEKEILDVFVQLVMALEYLHRNRILHRDLKPQNVFLAKTPDPYFTQVKLGDFGLARILGPHSILAETILGTPFQLSPELCQGKPYDHKSDVWALGTILYELVMRKRAFQAVNLPVLVGKIMRRDMEPPVSTRVRPDLLQLIDQMLQIDPARRPSMSAILQIPFIHDHAVHIVGKLDALADLSYQIKSTFRRLPSEMAYADEEAEYGGGYRDRAGSETAISEPSVTSPASTHMSSHSRRLAWVASARKPGDELDSTWKGDVDEYDEEGDVTCSLDQYGIDHQQFRWSMIARVRALSPPVEDIVLSNSMPHSYGYYPMDMFAASAPPLPPTTTSSSTPQSSTTAITPLDPRHTPVSPSVSDTHHSHPQSNLPLQPQPPPPHTPTPHGAHAHTPHAHSHVHPLHLTRQSSGSPLHSIDSQQQQRHSPRSPPTPPQLSTSPNMNLPHM